MGLRFYCLNWYFEQRESHKKQAAACCQIWHACALRSDSPKTVDSRILDLLRLNRHC